MRFVDCLRGRTVRITPRILLLVAVVISTILPFTRTLPAQNTEIITNLSVERAEAILKALKYNYEVVKPGEVYRFQIDGFKVLLFNKGKNLQFYAGFKPTKKPTLARINEWNATKRYSHAYLDKDRDPVIESDLDLEGGVTMGAINEFFRTWITSLKLFAGHLDFKK
jgi:hypothetical protein